MSQTILDEEEDERCRCVPATVRVMSGLHFLCHLANAPAGKRTGSPSRLINKGGSYLRQNDEQDLQHETRTKCNLKELILSCNKYECL